MLLQELIFHLYVPVVLVAAGKPDCKLHGFFLSSILRFCRLRSFGFPRLGRLWGRRRSVGLRGLAPTGRLSTRRLTVLPRQISRYSPPNRTYASRRIRLSNYPLPLLACYVSITGITNNQSFSVHLNHFSFPFFHTG